MTTELARLRIKTWICATVVVLANVFGNFFLKKGMPAELPTPWSYITVLFHPWVSLGVILLILWMMSRMTLLSWADLSYVLPVTAIGYVLVALMGRIFLDEQIPVKRWLGILLIVAGVGLVSLGTAPRTYTKEPLPVRWIYIAIIVGSTTVGEVLQAAGMRHHGEIQDFRPGALRQALAALSRNRFVIGGVVGMAVSFFAYLGLLTVSELSFAVPVTAITYVLETILAKYILKEQVNWLRWAGAGLVICGVALVSM